MNYVELIAMRKARYGDGFPADLTHVFIVRPEQVKYGLGSEQPCIGFERWHDAYRTLEIFQPPTKFYVLVVAEDGEAVNRAWLDGLASDVWFRERCLVHRIRQGGVLQVVQSRYSAHRQYPERAYGAKCADEAFERWHKFEPMPQHNHVQELDALSKDAVLPPKPQETSPYSTGWTAQAPLPPQATYDFDRPRRQEAAGGLAIGGGDDDNWK
jgi:hypothetical protein